MKKCSRCGKKMQKKTSKTADGVSYEFYRCTCGEEILDMKQLHDVAERYRKIKRFNARLSKWGNSLGLRIPKAIQERHDLDADSDVFIIDEKDGFKVVTV